MKILSHILTCLLLVTGSAQEPLRIIESSPTQSSDPGLATESIQKPVSLAELQLVAKEHTDLKGEMDLQKRNAEKLLSVVIFKKSSDVELDFESQHNEMLERLASVNSLISTLDEGQEKATELRRKVEELGGSSRRVNGIEELALYKRLGEEVPSLERRFKEQLADATSYRNDLNDTLIEGVHRYQIKNGFRTKLGMLWVAAFLLITAGIFWLFNKSILKPAESSTLQVVAMILILFVVLLFGICDVMGENGVTGLLAALAGYILGKSAISGRETPSAEEVAKLIKAFQTNETKDLAEGNSTLKQMAAEMLKRAKAEKIELKRLKEEAEKALKDLPGDAALTAKVADLTARMKLAEEKETKAESLVKTASELA